MAKKETVVLRKATIKKNKNYKFGQSLKKGEEVLISEKYVGHGRSVYTAVRKKGDTVEFGLTRSEFDYTDEDTFIVHVTRTVTSYRNVEVKAIDRKDALKKAIALSPDLNFEDAETDHSVHSVPMTAKEHKEYFN